MTLAQIKSAIKQLSEEERCELNAWLQDWPSDEWDKQMEADARSGKLDAMVNESVEEFKRGETRRFP